MGGDTNNTKNPKTDKGKNAFLKIRRPLFRGAPRLRDQDPLAFYQLAVIAIQLAAHAFMSLEGPKTGESAYPDTELEIWDFIKKRSVFKLVFEA